MTLSSQEWAAWVSAGAAVIQAIAAAAAIWYSGKLARDSADRERLAEANAARRIAEADAAAAAQRWLDRQEKEAAEVGQYNRPIDLAIALAESVYDELGETRERYKELAEKQPDRVVREPKGEHQRIAQDRIPQLENQTDRAEVVVSLRRLGASVGPFGAVHIPAGEWIEPIEQKRRGIREAIDQIYLERRAPPSTSVEG